MTYKAIVLDLDGTLTNNKKEITPLTKEALMSAQRDGMRVILASGRPTYGIRPVADELSIGAYDGYVMAYNGGCVTKWADKTILFNQTLDPALVPVLYNAAINAPHPFNILTYQGESIAATDINDKYVRHEAFINKMPLVQYDDFPNQVQPPINKCLIVVPHSAGPAGKGVGRGVAGQVRRLSLCRLLPGMRTLRHRQGSIARKAHQGVGAEARGDHCRG